LTALPRDIFFLPSIEPRRMRPKKCPHLSILMGIAWFALLVVNARVARASQEELRSPYPTSMWMVSQLIPSPQLVIDDGRAAFGARWQLTPVLYSFGIHRSQSPWRFFVVEPIVRQSGSLEWYVSPEYLDLEDDFSERFGLRTGLRSYVALVERGDYLSVSFGTSLLRYQEVTSVAYEVGAHSLFGFFGILASYSPTPAGDRFISTLQLRFF
jgi:hypothetical protein